MKSLVWQINSLNMMEKLVLEYLASSPSLNNIGYYRIPVAYMVCDLGATEHDVEVAIDGLIKKGYIAYDQQRSMVAIANFNRFGFKQNENPRNFVDALEFVPQSGVFAMTAEWLEKYYSDIKDKEWVKSAIATPVEDFVVTAAPVVEPVVVAETVAIAPSAAKVEVAEVKNEKSDIPIDAQEASSSEVVVESAEVINNVVATTDVAVDDSPADDDIVVVENETKAENTSVTEDTIEPPAEQESSEPPADTVVEPEVPKIKRMRTLDLDSMDPVTRKHAVDFCKLWEKYPRKNDRATSMKGYIYLVKNGELDFETANRAVDNYLAQIERDHTEQQYIIGGTSFFGRTRARIMEFITSEKEEKEKSDKEKLREELKPKFNMFLATYPRKMGIEIAEKNFADIVYAGKFTADQLINAAMAYASDCEVKQTEEQYIKRADTFLDTTTCPFRDYVDRDMSANFVNVHSGEIMDGYGEDDTLEQIYADLGLTKEEGDKLAFGDRTDDKPAEDTAVVDTPSEQTEVTEPVAEEDTAAVAEAVEAESVFDDSAFESSGFDDVPDDDEAEDILNYNPDDDAIDFSNPFEIDPDDHDQLPDWILSEVNR